MKFRLIAALCAFSLVTVAASATNYVTNGVFAPDNAGSGYGAVPGWSQAPYPSTLPNFTYLTGSNISNQPFYNNAVAPSPTVGFIQVFPGSPTDSLFQPITGLTVGGSYTFSYYENSRTGAAPDVKVTLGDLTLVGTHLDPSIGGNSLFRLITDTFTADASTADLSFLVTQVASGDDATALITNVSIAPTPEPSSLVLLGTGLIAAAGAARRKLRKA